MENKIIKINEEEFEVYEVKTGAVKSVIAKAVKYAIEGCEVTTSLDLECSFNVYLIEELTDYDFKSITIPDKYDEVVENKLLNEFIVMIGEENYNDMASILEQAFDIHLNKVTTIGYALNNIPNILKRTLEEIENFDPESLANMSGLFEELNKDKVI